MKTQSKKPSKPTKTVVPIQNELPGLPTGHFKHVDGIIQTINKITAKRNLSFSKMTKMQKRVALAEDVIASVRSKKYMADAGTYLSMDNKNDGSCDATMNNYKNADVQCNVCAIGSLFMSRVKKSKIGNLGRGIIHEDSDSMVKSLKGIFTNKELRLLEYAFEGDDIEGLFCDDTDEHDVIAFDCFSFHDKYSTDRGRLIGIMKNIIKNKGNFIYKKINLNNLK